MLLPLLPMSHSCHKTLVCLYLIDYIDWLQSASALARSAEIAAKSPSREVATEILPLVAAAADSVVVPAARLLRSSVTPTRAHQAAG